MKLPPRHVPRPPPPRGDPDPVLREQQRDFTDEGSPPPGRVGKEGPRREARDDDEQAGDRPPRRR